MRLWNIDKEIPEVMKSRRTDGLQVSMSLPLLLCCEKLLVVVVVVAVVTDV